MGSERAGVESCLADARFGPAYDGLLDVLAELAPVQARALPLASRAMATCLLPPPQQIGPGPQCQAVQRQAVRCQAVQRIVDAMGDESCRALCRPGAGAS